MNWAPSPRMPGARCSEQRGIAGRWGAGWVKVVLQSGGGGLRMAPSTQDPAGQSGARSHRAEEPCWKWHSPRFALGGLGAKQGLSQAGRGLPPASPAWFSALSPGAGWPLSPVWDSGECRAR